MKPLLSEHVEWYEMGEGRESRPKRQKTSVELTDSSRWCITPIKLNPTMTALNHRKVCWVYYNTQNDGAQWLA